MLAAARRAEARHADGDAEQHRAVHVCPDDEHGKHERRARADPSLGLPQEDPDEHDEEGVGEALRAGLREEQALNQGGAERDDHRDRRRVPPHEESREEAEGERKRNRARGADGRVPARAPELVEGQVGEPLLVDPGPAQAGDRRVSTCGSPCAAICLPAVSEIHVSE